VRWVRYAIHHCRCCASGAA